MERPAKMQSTTGWDKVMRQKGVSWCEVGATGLPQFSTCTGTFALTRAHRHKRGWYQEKENGVRRDWLLWEYDQVAFACMNCHQIIEKSAPLTEEVFALIRPEQV